MSRITRTSMGNIPVTGRLSLPPMSPHLTCQTDVQPATIGIRIYRQVLENRQGGGVNSQSWMGKNFSTVTLKLGSHSQTVSVRSLAMIAGETTQQQYIESYQVAYSMMEAGFLSVSLSGLYSFCVQGDRELPNICQLPVSVSWSPSDIIIHSVEFVLSAAIRPSCMQSSFLNSPTPEMPLKMFDKGIIDYDDSFLRVPIPSVPPVGAHMFAQFHIKASVKSANIQVVCKCYRTSPNVCQKIEYDLIRQVEALQFQLVWVFYWDHTSGCLCNGSCLSSTRYPRAIHFPRYWREGRFSCVWTSQ